jgi:hypothetical protein
MAIRVCASLLCLLLSGCASFGDAVEANCIKGQLSAAQAASLKPEEFETHPSYCAGRETSEGKNGDVHCQPEIYDRILAAHCSYALKEFEK